MKTILKVILYFFSVASFGGAGFLGYICYRQQCELEEMDVAVSSQREKIFKLEAGLGKLGVEELINEIDGLKDRLSSDRERIEQAEKSLEGVEEALEGLEDVKGSVENLSKGMFGTYPCSDFRYGFTALTFRDLPRDVDNLRKQIDDVRPKDYYDIQKTVEALSTYVYGEYPHSEIAMYTSIVVDGSLKEQLKKIKAKLDALELSVRYSTRY